MERSSASFRLLCAVSFILCAAFAGCERQETPEPENTPVAEGPVAPEPEELPAPSWSSEDGIVLILFGYGFNDEEFLNEARELLSSHYGLFEDGGVVSTVVFPDDLRGRISNFKDIIDENDVRGIVLLGAPEGTHNMLFRVIDEWDGEPPFNIISLFPQDDVLGQEAACSFVLDSAMNDDSPLEEQEHTRDRDTLSILDASVEYAALLPFRLERDADLPAHVQFIVGQRRITHYVDGESGIQSVNHFVLEAAD